MEHHDIDKTTGKLLRGEITKDEADEILLDLFMVSDKKKLIVEYQKYIDYMYGATGLHDERDIDRFLLNI